MSMKDKKVSVVESDEENEQGACGVSNDPRRFSLAVPETIPGNLLDDSVDNLSMEVHLGGDNHPSEISSISYQNLLDDVEPTNSIISRRGSDDSLDSYPPDFPDAELPPDNLETFEASDLPLSEHFPMGAMQGADSREKSRGDRSSYVSDNSSNISHANVRLKDQPSPDLVENVKMRDKNPNEQKVDADEASAKRSSLEIRNNIPVVGEVKDYEKELNLDFSRGQGLKSTVMGLKQSPGLARRVDIVTGMERDSSSNEDSSKLCDSSSSSTQQQSLKPRPKKTYSKTKENVIEVITPIPRNINIENEYDYVKYARVQQGNSYVGMRLAYSSSSDSLNLKQGVYSDNNSREPSPEKNLQQKITSNHESDEKVCEESLMEIPLNNSDFSEDKKAFTLSPENTECDSLEVESVTSEGGNSNPGFPTLEDGLSSSQASDVEEGISGISNERSPTRLVKPKQEAAVEQNVLKTEEVCRPKEMDAQAIMNDLKIKREALDMAIADIKSAIQRSKNMSLEPSYPSQAEPEGAHPVWVKRGNSEAASQIQRRQEEMQRVQEEIERQQEQLIPSQGKSFQEKVTEECADKRENSVTGQLHLQANNDQECVQSKEQPSTDGETSGACLISQIDLMLSALKEGGEETHSDESTAVPQVRTATDGPLECQGNELEHSERTAENENFKDHPSDTGNASNGLNISQHMIFHNDSSGIPDSDTPSNSSQNQDTSVNCETENSQNSVLEDHDKCISTFAQTAFDKDHIHITNDPVENLSLRKDTHDDFSIRKEKQISLNSAVQNVSNNVILSFGSWSLETTKIDNNFNLNTGNSSEKSQTPSLDIHEVVNMEQFDTLMQEEKVTSNNNSEKDKEYTLVEDIVNLFVSLSQIESDKIKDKENRSSECAQTYHAQTDCDDISDNESSEQSDCLDEAPVNEQTGEDCDTVFEDNDGQTNNIRLGEQRRGYDSDDECEDAEGIRYTRRNKGKKYAPLQKDDSLEVGGACAARDRDLTKSNGLKISSKPGMPLESNGPLTNHKQSSQLHLQSGENHMHNPDGPLSSEESSDIDVNVKTYTRPPNADSDTDEETDRLLQKQYQERDKHVEIPELNDPASASRRSEADIRHSKAKEAAIRDPDRPEVLIEGVLFRARYLGSTQLISEGQPSKAMRMMQAQEAVGRIKAPEGENQPSTDVDLFISTEKIMVLNTDLQEIMMDHSLRTISYIADIGDILVIMARRRLITSPDDMLGRRRRQAKILCHVFESDEAQLIAQSIGQAFQVAYLEFLKANGIEDPGLLKEMDYQDVLNQQEIYGEELNLFANKDFHKEVIVPKSKNEPLGVVIVESGWGSMVPTVVLANMLPTGPAARCGQLNIGDQIISINGISLVGLPLSACQTYIKASRSQTVVKLTVVPCPPVVEVLIKRPDVKYQLGFSVQNGVICSLLRGGIAERGGVRVGHRIIEINNQSVVAVPHEKIVTLLASSVGEIHMKTMPTSIFRLLTGQDVPHYL